MSRSMSKTILLFLKCLLADEQISLDVLEVVSSGLHFITLACTDDKSDEIKQLTMEVVYNLLAGIPQDSAPKFVSHNLGLAQFFMIGIGLADSDPDLATTAIECLQEFIEMGGTAARFKEQENSRREEGDNMQVENPVVRYCFDHPYFSSVEDAQKAMSPKVREMTKELINYYFT